VIQCPHCLRSFPENLLSEMCINGDYCFVCALCALKIRNAVAGLPPDTPFSGPIAAKMHKDALAHLRKTGQK
jgi:hypothetical protein